MRSAHKTADISDIEEALACIPADEREVWVQVGMALRSELGDAGFGIWDVWSESAGNYNEKAAKEVWKSFKNGSIRIGTLFYHARLNGWEGSKQTQTEKPKRSTSAYAMELWLKAEKSAMRSKHLEPLQKDITKAMRGLKKDLDLNGKDLSFFIKLRERELEAAAMEDDDGAKLMDDLKSIFNGMRAGGQLNFLEVVESAGAAQP